MPRRKLRWLLALAGLAGAVVLWPRPKPTDLLTLENVGRIETGMTRRQVEAILGPAGDYTIRPKGVVSLLGEHYQTGPVTLVFRPTDVWEGDTVTVYACFGPTDILIFRAYGLSTPMSQGPLDNLLWRAKRQWRRWFPG